jgi:hypothetical protein
MAGTISDFSNNHAAPMPALSLSPTHDLRGSAAQQVMSQTLNEKPPN